MKIFKYNSVKLAFLVQIIYSILSVISGYILSLIVVDDINILYKNFIIIFFVYVFYGIFFFLQFKLISISEFYIKMDLRQKIDKRISKMTYSEYITKDYGERLSIYINDIDTVVDLTFKKPIQIVSNITIAIFTFISLIKIHYSMVILSTFFVIIMIVFPKLFQKKLSQYIVKKQEEKEIFLSKMREYLQGFQTFLENDTFNLFLKKSRKSSYEYAKFNVKAEIFAGFMSTVLTFINFISIIVSLFVLSYFILMNNVKVGSLLSIFSLIPNFGSSIMQIFSDRAFLSSGKTLYNEKFSEFDEKFEEKNFYKNVFLNNNVSEVNIFNECRKNFEILKIELKDIEVKFDKVNIKFPKSLIFEKGKKYAIIGESGSGKSTLLKVLLGEIKDYSGKILINGKEEKLNLFKYIAYVNQQVFLLNDTLKCNIDMENKLSEKEVNNIISLMKLNNMDSNYVIKDNGRNLSGGQRQKITIARAMARNKSIFILDEACANMDTETSNFIESLILNKENATVIFITHHLNEKIENLIDEKIIL